MEKRYCKKCGAELPEGCKCKLCRDCRKKRKRIKKAVKIAVACAGVAAGAAYVWSVQPAFVKKMVKKSAERKVADAAAKVKLAQDAVTATYKQAEAAVMSSYRELESRSRELAGKAARLKLLSKFN